MLAECALLDGSTAPEQSRTVENIETDTLAAVDNAGRIAAYGWLTAQPVAHQARVFIDGRVHPDYRGQGLGRFLLQWAEARARQMLTATPPDLPAVLRLDFHDRSPDALALFEAAGYHFAFAEDEMAFDLAQQPLPAAPAVEGEFITWAAATPTAFFEVYADAFRTRPGFPNWPEATWVENFTGSASFRPDLSLLLRAGGRAVAFAVCHVEAELTGTITQIGVRPAARQRGYATAIMLEVLRRLQQAGLTRAVLDVNANNPEAAALYQKLGFRLLRRYTSYQKNR